MIDTDPIGNEQDQNAAAQASTPLPSLTFSVSGLYTTGGIVPSAVSAAQDESSEAAAPSALPLPTPILPLLGEELRLDVDGRYPQMIVSGTIPISTVQRLHWISRVQKIAANKWRGGIWYKDPASSPLGYNVVEVVTSGGPLPSSRTATATFTGPGLPSRVRTYGFRSPYFHKVEFEYDAEQQIVAGTAIQSCAHPNRPASLACETLSIQSVFRRSGFDVRVSPNRTAVPTPPGGTWSDMEMHDAMTAFWSRFASKAQWAMWVLFAKRHESGPGLGGIMFDDIGPNHRQGTALFYDSFISSAPGGDPNPAAWVQRMRFWTAVHEMGHAFNLAHSWQKALGTPWIPLANEPQARSFMNYPFNVTGGQTAFFANFEYRFSNGELLFMRHAPARFVRMGDAAWFDHHGFEQASLHPEPPLSLEVRFNRTAPPTRRTNGAPYQFLEPVVAELKLKNVSSEPQIVDEHVLTTLNSITIALKREGSPAKQHLPYAQYCMKPTAKVLEPGQAIYGSVFLTAGLNGVDVAEPGRYVVQAALHTPAGDIVSNAARLRIAPPREYKEEEFAQDFFTDSVGRVLAFDGSHVLTDANGVLEQAAEMLSDREVARHARVTLGIAAAEAAQVLEIPGEMTPLDAASEPERLFRTEPAKPDEARYALTTALMSDTDEAAQSMGHIDYKYYVDQLTDLLVAQGDRQEAIATQDKLYAVLNARGVIARVLAEIEAKRESIKVAAAGR